MDESFKVRRFIRPAVLLRIGDGYRKHVPWLEAWKRIDWYLTFDNAQQRLGKFLFPR